MILGAAIISKDKQLYCSNNLPYNVGIGLSKHAESFLYLLSIQSDDIELPYIETTNLRYIYKQTDDLYWLLITNLESEMYTDIHILGKFVCTIMEYGSLETNSSTITDEQRELFYRHILRPWDDEYIFSNCFMCTRYCNCIDWEREFENRLQFLVSIRDGDVGEEDVMYFNGLIAEAWCMSSNLSSKSSLDQKDNFHSDIESTGSTESGNSIGEETLVDRCRLKCRLEDIRIVVARIQDPYMRLFARRDLLSGSCNGQCHQVSSAPSEKDLDLELELHDSHSSF